MTVEAIYSYLGHLMEDDVSMGEKEVTIPIHKDDVILGHHPYVSIQSVGLGFDWDKNSVFIYPSKQLTLRKK